MTVSIILGGDLVPSAVTLADEIHIVRGQRNAKLAESDWTQLPDAPLSAEEKAAWAAYRQQLRDITNDQTILMSDFAWPILN